MGLYMSEAGGEAVQMDVPTKVFPGRAVTGCSGPRHPMVGRCSSRRYERLDEAKRMLPRGSRTSMSTTASRPEGERLVDLAPAPAGQHAGVQAVLGSSEDGSYVYFVANGVLGNGEPNGNGEAARQGTCVPFAGVGECNLYEWHEGAIRFVAVLTGTDGDWRVTGW
jgi:hypothetical protein